MQTNLVIVVNHGRDTSAVITNCLPDVQLQFNGQCFPLYWYENDEGLGGLFADADVKQDGHTRP